MRALGGLRPSRRTWRLFAATVGLMTVALGCGGDDDTGEPTAGEVEPTIEYSTSDDVDETSESADEPITDEETATGAAALIDPSIEVPEWVEVADVAEMVNVRAGPGADFERVATALLGDSLRVLGGDRNADGEIWLLVEAGGEATGWVFDEYTNPIPRPTPTPLPTPTPAGTPTPLPVDTGDAGSDGDLVVVAPDGLNLRDSPGLGGEVLLELDDGDRLTGTGESRRADGRRWTEVIFDGVTGWVASEFVAPA